MSWIIQAIVQAAAWMVGFLSTLLVLDHLRRRGLPRLSLRIPRLSLKSGPSVPEVPDSFYLRLAKTITEGEFDGANFARKPFRDLFPTQSACPHCRGGGRRVWDIGEATQMLTDASKLARRIKRKRLCRGCLDQLSEVAEVKGKLRELGTGDPRSLSIRSLRWVRPFLLLLAVAFIVLLLTSFLSLAPWLLWFMANLPTLIFR